MSSNHWSKWFPTVIIGVFVIGWLVMLIGSSNQILNDSNENFKHPVLSTIGNITQIDIKTINKISYKNYDIDIHYSFIVNEKTYYNKFNKEVYRDYDKDEILTRYPIGSKITIYYRDGKPDKNSLSKSSFDNTLEIVIMCLSLFFIMISGTLGGISFLTIVNRSTSNNVNLVLLNNNNNLPNYNTVESMSVNGG